MYALLFPISLMMNIVPISLQLLISACDGGNKCDYGYLEITVDSNLFAPTLTKPGSELSYMVEVIILENINTNQVIYTVEGMDNDASVSDFHIY